MKIHALRRDTTYTVTRGSLTGELTGSDFTAAGLDGAAPTYHRCQLFGNANRDNDSMTISDDTGPVFDLHFAVDDVVITPAPAHTFVCPADLGFFHSCSISKMLTDVPNYFAAAGSGDISAFAATEFGISFDRTDTYYGMKLIACDWRSPANLIAALGTLENVVLWETADFCVVMVPFEDGDSPEGAYFRIHRAAGAVFPTRDAVQADFMVGAFWSQITGYWVSAYFDNSDLFVANAPGAAPAATPSAPAQNSSDIAVGAVLGGVLGFAIGRAGGND